MGETARRFYKNVGIYFGVGDVIVFFIKKLIIKTLSTASPQRLYLEEGEPGKDGTEAEQTGKDGERTDQD